MLEVTFATWQLADGTFLPAAPSIRTVAGPPGLTVIVQMAWRHDCPEGRSFCFRGFARVRRVLATGETDHRFLHFTAVPCPHAPRVHIAVDRDLGGTARDDDFQSEWHGPCCVPLARDDDEDAGHDRDRDLRDADVRAGRAFEDNDAGAGRGAAESDGSAAAGGDAA